MTKIHFHFLVTQVLCQQTECKVRTCFLTHIRLAAVGSASIAAHFGRLHGLSQRDGVRLVLFIHFFTIIVFWLVMLEIIQIIKIKKNYKAIQETPQTTYKTHTVTLIRKLNALHLF